MKVGIFCSEIPSTMGGGYTFFSEILQAFLHLVSESPHEFVVISYSHEPPQALSSSDNVRYLSLHKSFQERLRYKLSFLRTAISALKHPGNPIKQKPWKFNVVENTLITNNIDIIWNIVSDCLSTEVPYITTVWDLGHRVQPYFPELSTEGCTWDEREQFYAPTLRRASFIITGTETGKTEIERFYEVPSERIRVLPFPTPQFALDACPANDQQILEKYHLQKGYLFYPAKFWPHKNHVNLLLAIRWLRDQYNLDFTVVFSGFYKPNSKQQQYVRELVEEFGLSHQVKFLGLVPQADLIALYRNAFALTFVTFLGPDNLPPLEAFALGCPVIASKVSGAQEQLGDAALLVDPKDPEHIADAIKLLWEDSVLRQSLIQRGLARAYQWTKEDYVRGVFAILDEFAAIRRCWPSGCS